jgi:FecR protein
VRPCRISSSWSHTAALLVGLLSCAGAWAALPEAATVAGSRGETSLMRESSLSSPVRVSASLRSGDRVVTGSDGRLELRFTDAAFVAIGPDSEFKIESYQFDAQAQQGFFALARGVIHTVSGEIGKRRHDDYRLTTPTGVLGIRGTEFDVEHVVCRPDKCPPGARPGLAVTVVKGRVAITNDAGTIEVPAGAAVYLKDRATPAVFTKGGTVKRAPARSGRGSPSFSTY